MKNEKISLKIRILRFPIMRITQIQNDELITQTEITTTATLITDSLTGSELHFKAANCGFQVIYSKGCYACNKPGEVIIQPVEIKSEGLLHFSSNCTFSSNNIPCRAKPFKMNLLYLQNNCLLTFPEINRTLMVEIDYIFLGNLSHIGVMHNSAEEPSVMDTVGLLINNPTFMRNLYYSFSIGVALTILIRIVTNFLVFREGRLAVK